MNCPEAINQIDWPIAFGVIRDIVITIATAVTAIVAVRGLNKWHTELTGKAAFDTAHALAKATYRLRDNIQACRSPLLRGAEFPESYSSNSTGKEKVAAYLHVYQKRWDPVKEAMLEFNTQAIEAESLWGPPVIIKTEALRCCITDIYVAIREVLEDVESGGKTFEENRELAKEMRSTLHASLKDENNVMNVRINEAVKDIEGLLRKHLGRSS